MFTESSESTFVTTNLTFWSRFAMIWSTLFINAQFETDIGKIVSNHDEPMIKEEED